MSIAGTQDLAWQIVGGALLAGTQDVAWRIDDNLTRIGGFQALTWGIGVTEDTITVVLEDAPTGLVGTLTVSIITADGSLIIYFPTTQGIEEVPAGTGRYVATVPFPDIGEYFVVWSDGNTTVQAGLIVRVLAGNSAHLRVLKAPVAPLDDGDLMEFVAAVSDHNDALVDPEILVLSIIAPDGQRTVYRYGDDAQIIRDSLGTYRATVPIFRESSSIPPNLTSRIGAWRWESSGDYADAEEGRFVIRRSLVLS